MAHANMIWEPTCFADYLLTNPPWSAARHFTSSCSARTAAPNGAFRPDHLTAARPKNVVAATRYVRMCKSDSLTACPFRCSATGIEFGEHERFVIFVIKTPQ